MIINSKTDKYPDLCVINKSKHTSKQLKLTLKPTS